MMASLWSPAAEEAARYPELTHLALLDHELQLLEQVMTAGHQGEGRAEIASHQARSMVGVMRLLRGQIESYRGLLALPRVASSHGRR